jgi:hypothetical protein
MPAMSLADTVRVDGPAACTDCGPDCCALSAPSQSTDTCAGESGSAHRQLVTMFLPESPFVALITMSRDSRSGCRLRRRNRLPRESQR